jgi:hypothetical protein
MAVTQTNDLGASQFDFPRAVIDQDKIIARSVHLGEFQNHGGNV